MVRQQDLPYESCNFNALQLMKGIIYFNLLIFVFLRIYMKVKILLGRCESHFFTYIFHTVQNKTFNILKVLEKGPLRLVKVTFTRPLQDIYSFKGHLS